MFSTLVKSLMKAIYT